MAKRSSMSPGEWDVAQAVWRLGEASVGAVHQEVSTRREMDYATVQTYLRRLESKGYLRTRRQGRGKQYSPKVPAKKAIKESVSDFVNRVFEGEPLALMHHLVNDHGISADEARELRDYLDHLAEEGEPE